MNQDIELINYLAKKDKEIEKLYNKLLYQLGKVSLNLTKIREGAFFSFDDYPELKAKVDDILNTYSTEQQDIIINGINKAVRMSFQANDELFGEYSRYSETALTDMRKTAADAFIASRMKPEQGLSLSQRVWNYTRQAKAEFEAGMSEIIEENLLLGTSAEELGRLLRGKLKNPDMVYRRYHLKKLTSKGKKDVVEWRRKVVDANGNVRYVKEDMEKVGRGIYRSSRKNALRLAATEINMAYRYADNVRWNSEPFVTGFKIELSGRHPVYDMCDELTGVYPKTFLWRGWHPRCLCIATPTLIPKSEMNKIADLPDDEYNRYRSKHLVKKMPKKYDEYIKKNRKRILDAQSKGTTPYWILDNYKDGDITKKYRWERIGKTKFKTDAEKKAIQEAWDLRKRKNAIEAARVKRHANRDEKAIQEAWDKRRRKRDTIIKSAFRVAQLVISKYPSVDITNLQWLYRRQKYNLLEDEVKLIAAQIKELKKRADDLGFSIEQMQNFEDIERVFKLMTGKSIKRGKPMSAADADKQSANPNYQPKFIRDDKGIYQDKKGNKYSLNTDYKEEFTINCATCAPAYVLRRFGFDFIAKGKTANSLNDVVSRGKSFDLWLNNDKTKASPHTYRNWMSAKKYKRMTPKRYYEFFDECCDEEGIYVVTIAWKGNAGGHATIIERLKDGRLVYIEPQSYDAEIGVYRDIMELCNEGKGTPTWNRGVLRVDDKLFNTTYLSIFDK